MLTERVAGIGGRTGQLAAYAAVLVVLVGGVSTARASVADDAAIQPAQPTAAQLQQLVAPIALYPDSLVAQILAAATYPEQIVEADRWVEQHSALQGPELAKEVDAQPWDPSVKAVAQLPAVLGNMDKNLSWTSALGDAWVNEQEGVMDAIQTMRHRAHDAGKLETTREQSVVTQGSQIVIQPANPKIVYVPQYDPWLVYGAPVVAWPGWYAFPGIFVAEPGIAFGVGFDIGLFAGFGWGWHHWNCDWGRRVVVHDHDVWASHGRTFANRRAFERERATFGDRRGFGGGFRGDGERRGGDEFRGGRELRGGESRGGGELRGGESRGFAAPRGMPEGRWGAFSGFDHGGATRGLSERGSASFGGLHGGGFGGGFHGGGGGHR